MKSQNFETCWTRARPFFTSNDHIDSTRERTKKKKKKTNRIELMGNDEATSESVSQSSSRQRRQIVGHVWRGGEVTCEKTAIRRKRR